MTRPSPWWLAAALVAPAVSAPGLQLDLDVGTLEGEGIRAAGIAASVDLETGSFRVQVDRVGFGGGTAIEHFQIRCADGKLSIDPLHVDCEDARISLRHPLLVLDDNPGRVHWHGEGGGHLEVDQVPLLGDGVNLEARPQDGAWFIGIRAPAVDVTALTAGSQASGFSFSGTAALTAELTLGGGQPMVARLALEHESLAFQDAEARYLADGLGGRLDLTLGHTTEGWQGSLDGDWTRGEMLSPFFYVQAEPAHRISLSANLDVPATLSDVHVRDFVLSQRPWISLKGNAELGLSPESDILRSLDAELAPLDLGAAFERYLAPLFIDPLASSLSLTGRVAGGMSIRGGRVAGGKLRLDDLWVEDPEQGRLSVGGLNGRLDVALNGRGQGEFTWRDAHLYGFEFGAARLPLKVEKKAVVLREPTSVGLFDGRIEIGALAFDWAEPPYSLTFDAVLTPVSMDKVSRALGWIPMQGQLSGVVPKVRLRGGALTLDGALLMRVFDGSVVIRDLSVSDLFGYWPILNAHAECRNLDLDLLTGTYEFGRITGHIDGDIRALRMENWRPTAFDARFASSPDDDSPHRISQKAVDSIVSLSGSGMPGVLSRGFLRFFDEFRYDRLGIACRLQNGVCEMDGVEHADDGYYLVKGGGIPRIDVIGFNRFTDWDVLLERLQAVTSGGPPVIQ